MELSDIVDIGAVTYAYFADRVGESWVLQEIPARFRP